MNLFILDNDPIIAASYNCDKHVVKIILEAAQMMSTAHHILETSVDRSVLYRKTHINHPMSVWVRSSLGNYTWTYKHFLGLCREYTLRYNKNHLVETKLGEILAVAPEFNCLNLMEFPQCMPESCQDSSPIKAYRNYYIQEKAHIAKWKLGNTPEWFKEVI